MLQLEKYSILWEPGESLIHLLYPGIQEGVVVGWIMAPKYIEPQSLEPVIVTLCGKGALLDVNKLRVLRWGGYPGLSDWTQYNHKGL